MTDCYQYEPRGSALTTLQRHLPTGLAWDAYRTVGKNLYQLWSAFATAYDDMSAALCRMIRELDPSTTVDMIGEWERAVGLPDPCLPQVTTLGERRFWVLWRLGRRRWTTAAEWIELAGLFGLDIRITPGWYVQRPALYDWSYPKRYDIFPKLGRFRVYIDVLNVPFAGYDYGRDNRGPGYPIPYGSIDDRLASFICIIDRVRPANVVVIYNGNPLNTNKPLGISAALTSQGTAALDLHLLPPMTSTATMTTAMTVSVLPPMTSTATMTTAMTVSVPVELKSAVAAQCVAIVDIIRPVMMVATANGRSDVAATIVLPASSAASIVNVVLARVIVSMRTSASASVSVTTAIVESPTPPPPPPGDTGSGS